MEEGVYLEAFGKNEYAHESFGVIGPFRNNNEAKEWIEQMQRKDPRLTFDRGFPPMTPAEFEETLEDD